MTTALDTPASALDEHEQNFVADVREHGWFRTAVSGDNTSPIFSFTTGFWLNADHPELLLFSMKGETAHDIFWDLYRDAKADRPLIIGARTPDVFSNAPAYAFPVAKRFYAEYLGWSRWFYGNDNFPCLQIVWPDREGTFPWETGFDPAFADSQPDLTENGWKAALVEQ